jgi:CDP-diacylglycerol--serine O-phosphatidyltransferase
MKMPNIAVLPALVTLGNGVCGFAAVALLLRTPLADATGDAARPLANFATAGLLVFLAMIFDALDGRVARFARATSDFGGQLDSLCDAVSFGAAPALLAFRLFADSVSSPAFHRLAVVLAVLYFACTLLRLARFNVENLHDEEAHMAFRGLPSPAAAGAVASLVVLIVDFRQGDLRGNLGTALVWVLPAALLILGLLMVSTIRYAHLLNQLIRGRRPISHVIEIFICIALIWFLQEKALAALFCAYVVSGPAMMVYRRLRLARSIHAARMPAADHRDESLRQ